MRGCVSLSLALATVVLAATMVHGGLTGTFLHLERAIPLNQRVELEVLRARDRERHGRILQGGFGGVVNFAVQGTSDPYFVGLYFTKVKLGSPAKEFYVQIDTGSDVLWLNCMTCRNCPQSSGLGIVLDFFDTASSSTAAFISCADPICSYAVQTATSECSSQANHCSYTFQYGDGSGTTGYYVSDTMYFDTVLGQELVSNSSSTIVFGPHYNLNLQSIAVNGQLLPIDSGVFATTNNRGTIVDTGTTLAYLVQEAYNPFVDAITAAVSQFSKPIISKGNQCYLVSNSVGDIFPQVSLNFMGGASMVLDPEHYLMHYGFLDAAAMWCIGFQKGEQGFTILGDLVLKDKIFVYDLANQRIGWANYDCSLAVNVSMATSKSKDAYINNSGHISEGCSHIGTFSKLLAAGIAAFLVHIVFMEFPFL